MHTAAGNCSMCVYYNRKSSIHLNEKQNAFLDNKGNRKRQLLYIILLIKLLNIFGQTMAASGENSLCLCLEIKQSKAFGKNI